MYVKNNYPRDPEYEHILNNCLRDPEYEPILLGISSVGKLLTFDLVMCSTPLCLKGACAVYNLYDVLYKYQDGLLKLAFVLDWHSSLGLSLFSLFSPLSLPFCISEPQRLVSSMPSVSWRLCWASASSPLLWASPRPCPSSSPRGRWRWAASWRSSYRRHGARCCSSVAPPPGGTGEFATLWNSSPRSL